jgi:hypothetical protein
LISTCCCPSRRVTSAPSGTCFPCVTSSWPTHPNLFCVNPRLLATHISTSDRSPLQECSLRPPCSSVAQFRHLCGPSQESAIDNRNSLNDPPLAGSNAGLVPMNYKGVIHKREGPAIFDWVCSSGADLNQPPEMCRLQRVGRTDRSARQFCTFPPSLNHSHLNPQNTQRSEPVNRNDENLRFQTIWNRWLYDPL